MRIGASILGWPIGTWAGVAAADTGDAWKDENKSAEDSSSVLGGEVGRCDCDPAPGCAESDDPDK